MNAHHQNGRAEAKIRRLTETARTMILHANHRWPQAVTAHLWPYALRMASRTGNHLPRDSKEAGKKGRSPIELFSKTKRTPNFKDEYPFACPVHVLHETLANGKYHPRWKDRSRVGLYLGKSPDHASSVALDCIFCWDLCSAGLPTEPHGAMWFSW